MEDLQATITKVLTDQPIGFKVADRHFYIYPATLGKTFLTASLVESLGLRKNNLSVSPLLELVRVAKTERDACCRLIAYHTAKGKKHALNSGHIAERTRFFADNLADEDIATLITAILKDTSLEEIVRGTDLDKEADRMRRVNAAKSSKNTFIFGGKTVWGTLIDAACERYGWTFDYVLWGISYHNLTLMLKDKVTSVYLTDEERKKVHIPDYSGETISGDDREAVMRMVRESERNPN